MRLLRALWSPHQHDGWVNMDLVTAVHVYEYEKVWRVAVITPNEYWYVMFEGTEEDARKYVTFL